MMSVPSLSRAAVAGSGSSLATATRSASRGSSLSTPPPSGCPSISQLRAVSAESQRRWSAGREVGSRRVHRVHGVRAHAPRPVLDQVRWCAAHVGQKEIGCRDVRDGVPGSAHPALVAEARIPPGLRIEMTPYSPRVRQIRTQPEQEVGCVVAPPLGDCLPRDRSVLQVAASAHGRGEAGVRDVQVLSLRRAEVEEIIVTGDVADAHAGEVAEGAGPFQVKKTPVFGAHPIRKEHRTEPAAPAPPLLQRNPGSVGYGEATVETVHHR